MGVINFKTEVIDAVLSDHRAVQISISDIQNNISSFDVKIDLH